MPAFTKKVLLFAAVALSVNALTTPHAGHAGRASHHDLAARIAHAEYEAVNADAHVYPVAKERKRRQSGASTCKFRTPTSSVAAPTSTSTSDAASSTASASSAASTTADAASSSSAGGGAVNVGSNPSTIVSSHQQQPTSTQASTTAQQSATSAPPPPPPPPATSSSSVPPPPPPPPATSSSSAPPSSSSSSSSGGSSGSSPGGGPACDLESYLCGTQSGDGTYYATGLGACGITNTDSDHIVAVSMLLFDTYPGYAGTNPNDNPVCNRQIQANYQGNSVTVTVTDRCTGCNTTSLDFAPSAFQILAGSEWQTIGRIHDMTWDWI